jgi:hypothetical protein
LKWRGAYLAARFFGFLAWRFFALLALPFLGSENKSCISGFLWTRITFVILRNFGTQTPPSSSSSVSTLAEIWKHSVSAKGSLELT